MLLIWDIHLTLRIKDKLLSQLKSFVAQHNEEKNLILLWDFVYHFSYDRSSLLELYELFLEWYMEWKNVYVLAWNHDWLGNMFVFEEWKKAFEILSKIRDHHDNEICFITEPMVKEIEWKQICFLPAVLDIDETKFPEIDELKNGEYKDMLQSKNKNIIFSAQLNLLVERYVRQYKDLTVIHHYYIEWVSFPWQQSKFWFKDRALSQKWLDKEWLLMISWHLHQAFAYKNYFCTWSIRASSSLENEQIKYFRSLEWNIFTGWESAINYYFVMARPIELADLFEHRQRAINQLDIINHRKQLQIKIKENFRGNQMTVNINGEDSLNLKSVSLSVIADRLQYDNMAHFIDVDTHQSLQNVQLKKESVSMEKMLEWLEKKELSWSQSFWDWLDLLKTLLKKQYPEEYDDYEKILQEMKIL